MVALGALQRTPGVQLATVITLDGELAGFRDIRLAAGVATNRLTESLRMPQLFLGAVMPRQDVPGHQNDHYRYNCPDVFHVVLASVR